MYYAEDLFAFTPQPCYPPGKRVSATKWVRTWLGPRVSRCAVENFLLRPGNEPKLFLGRLVPSLVIVLDQTRRSTKFFLWSGTSQWRHDGVALEVSPVLPFTLSLPPSECAHFHWMRSRKSTSFCLDVEQTRVIAPFTCLSVFSSDLLHRMPLSHKHRFKLVSPDLEVDCYLMLFVRYVILTQRSGTSVKDYFLAGQDISCLQGPPAVHYSDHQTPAIKTCLMQYIVYL